MTVEINPLIENVSIGGAYGAIDCVSLGCLETVDIRLEMKEFEIICDITRGLAGIIRYDPRGEVTITPINFSLALLAKALDATVGVTSGNEVATGELHYPTWVPDDPATPTEWTADISLANGEVESGTIEVWDDSAASISWDDEVGNSVTALALCSGSIRLTATDVNECLSAVYISYEWGTQIPSGSAVLEPAFGTYAADHKLTFVHKHAQTGNYLVYKIWRMQISPNFSMTFGQTARNVSAPIRCKILEDSVNHPDSPLGAWYEIASSVTDFDFAPYTDVPGTT